MQRYGNKNRQSGVSAYETGGDFIRVRFVNGGVYEYNHEKPGRIHVKRMKNLAAQGRGLSTYISQRIKSRYFAKIK
jgi:hypothetical protein